jgi:methylenetetrahydrofolate reductase (NADPH)
MLRAVEQLSKTVLFDCKDCGDCSLPDIAYLCPESQCAKNQRNGPCGGTRDGLCEVDGFGDCIWLRAYERLKQDGKEQEMLNHAPVVQNQALRKTSAWANNWLGRDHAAKHANMDSKNEIDKQKKVKDGSEVDKQQVRELV